MRKRSGFASTEALQAEWTMLLPYGGKLLSVILQALDYLFVNSTDGGIQVFGPPVTPLL
jgi:hypothetical protein